MTPWMVIGDNAKIVIMKKSRPFYVQLVLKIQLFSIIPFPKFSSFSFFRSSLVRCHRFRSSLQFFEVFFFDVNVFEVLFNVFKVLSFDITVFEVLFIFSCPLVRCNRLWSSLIRCNRLDTSVTKCLSVETCRTSSFVHLSFFLSARIDVMMSSEVNFINVFTDSFYPRRSKSAKSCLTWLSFLQFLDLRA